MSEEQLRKAILRCVRCELSSRHGVSPVPWHGPVGAEVAVVGEAPGMNENVQGRPFVRAGASGRYLRKHLELNGMDLDDMFVCNTVSCFPDATPSVEHQKACRIHLKRQLRLARAKYVLVLGSVALNYFDPDLRVTKHHGVWRKRTRSYETDELIVNEVYHWFPTFHPSGALQRLEWRGKFENDIKRFCHDVLSGTIL